MDAISLITKHFDIDKLLKHYDFNRTNSDGDIIRACCKLHNGNNPTAFVINRETGLWYCHTGACGGGDVFTLVQRMESVDFPSSVQWLSKFFDVDIRNLDITERKIEYIEELKQFIKVMKGRKKIQIPPFNIAEEIKQVTKYRNFQPSTLEHFKLGYVDEVQLTKRNGGHYTLRSRLVFPIYFNNIQVALSFKKIKANDVPKWSHQPPHIEMKEILYNYDDAKHSTLITICEGIDDVWAFYEIGASAVATFGAHVTKEQYKLLLQTGADLVFAFDGDEAGKLVTARAIKLFKYKANISVIYLPDGEDAESIGREELKVFYDRRKKM